MISPSFRLATVIFALSYLSQSALVKAESPFLGCLSEVSSFAARIPLAPLEVCAVQAVSSRFSFLICTRQDYDTKENQLDAVPFSLNCLGRCARYKYASFSPNRSTNKFQCECSDTPPEGDHNQPQGSCTATSRYWYTRPLKKVEIDEQKDRAAVKALVGGEIRGPGSGGGSSSGKQSVVWGRKGRTKAFCPNSLVSCKAVHE
ncbi:hypothetical protein IAU59_001344 [Kwoniella sp. CBS 9459]